MTNLDCGAHLPHDFCMTSSGDSPSTLRGATEGLRVSFARARAEGATAVAALRTSAALDLTERFGKGHWSGKTSERGVLAGMRDGHILIARRGSAIVGCLRLSTKKPWAIDTSYFTPVARAIYLTDMAVRPDYQGKGIGRAMLAEAARIAGGWPADCIRLDAWNADAGAGDFYEHCGLRRVGLATYRDVPLVYYELLLPPRTLP
jgi:ribosomal protein S18 acetylase RimI-like enzyme